MIKLMTFGKPDRTKYVALTLLLSLGTFPALAAPTITWTPSAISESLSPGQSKTVSASFTSSDDIQKLGLWATEALAPYVSFQPLVIENVRGGQPISIVVTITVPADAALAEVSGEVHLRLKDQRRRRGTDAAQSAVQSLPVALSIVSPGNGLPPDPGAEGLKTVEGIDSDNDGVRDDIQRYLAGEFGQRERTHAALTQIAIALQDQLASGQSKQQALIAAARVLRGVECLASVGSIGSGQARSRALVALQAEVLNTQLRWDAYRQFEAQIWGEIIPAIPLDQQQSSCTFDVDSLSD